MLSQASVKPCWMLMASMGYPASVMGSASPVDEPRYPAMREGNRSGGISPRHPGLRDGSHRFEHDFDRALALALKHVVGVWGALQRQPVGDEVVQIERIGRILDERDQVV